MEFEDIKKPISDIKCLTGNIHGKWLFDIVKTLPDNALVCEVGTYYGYLSAVMAYASINTNRRIIMIDHMIGTFCDFVGKCIYLDVINNMIRHNVWNKIIPLPMKSKDALELFEIWKPTIYLLYLDGDHNEDPVFEELTKFSKFIPIGGLMCGDDCLPIKTESFTTLWNKNDLNLFYYQGVSQAVWRFFRNNHEFEVLPNVPTNQFGFKRIK